MEHIDALVRELRGADEERVEAIKAELTALCSGQEGDDARSYLEKASRAEVLAVQWELEEVVEATTPKKAAPPPAPAEPEPEPEPEPDKPLTAADLEVVYDDPRGLLLHRTKDGRRWFATQMDPATGQPQTFELRDHEVSQLRIQLSGSPYWADGAP